MLIVINLRHFIFFQNDDGSDRKVTFVDDPLKKKGMLLSRRKQNIKVFSLSILYYTTEWVSDWTTVWENFDSLDFQGLLRRLTIFIFCHPKWADTMVSVFLFGFEFIQHLSGNCIKYFNTYNTIENRDHQVHFGVTQPFWKTPFQLHRR